MKIILRTLAEGESHPYETIGNWKIHPNGDMEIIVSRMENADSEFWVAIHEAIEAWLCQKRGITDEKVTAHDKMFEAERAQGLHGEDDEPGDDPRAPYRKEHEFATLIEMLGVRECGILWKDHCK
jgi:hypothetical protein